MIIIIIKETVQRRTIATTATNMLECKKVLTFLLSVHTSDWLKQQKLTKLHKAVHIFITIFHVTKSGLSLSNKEILCACMEHDCC